MKAAPVFNIGTSGWNYKHWRNKFYPKGIKDKELLEYYARFFDVTEINTSFYHLPRESTVINWVELVPETFRFCPKISRYITHFKQLKEVEEPLERFFNVFDHIVTRLGPVLIQLPRTVHFKHEKTEILYRVLKERYSQYDFAMEVRHDSWFTEESITLMKAYNIALVISHSGGHFPYHEAVTSKNIYLRFHGPDKLYASKYPTEILEEYAQKFKKWIAENHTIWAFFNNDVNGYAVEDALILRKMLEAK